jgi:hypothetical protein
MQIRVFPKSALSQFVRLISLSSLGNGKLFEGGSQYDRFRTLLKRVVMDHPDEIMAMGVDPRNLGVHSIRKGAATFCCNGTTHGCLYSGGMGTRK